MRHYILFLLLLATESMYGQSNSNVIADSLFKAKNWKASAVVYDNITRANPNPKTGMTFNRLGTSYYNLGKFNEAVPAFRRAIEISGNPSVMYSLACVYNKLENKDSCYRWLEKAANKGFNQYQHALEDEDLMSLRGENKFESILARIKVNAMPCLALPEYRQFDFWIGEWKVVDTKTGSLAGMSSVNLILDNCVVFENWQPTSGFAAKSFNIFDSKDKKWKQTYVTADGQLLEFTDGEYKDHSMQFTLSSSTNELKKMTFIKEGEDRVRQIGELSTDGKTWMTEYDLTYLKIK
jgi:tetratricopeptide (TPR) repeat protein